MDTLKSLQQKLIMIFIALFIGQLAFALIVYFVLQPQPKNAPDESVFMAICAFLLFSGIVGGMIISRKRLGVIRELPDKQKGQQYVSVSIIRYALLEAAILFAIIQFLLTGNQIFLVFTGVGLAYFLTLFPGNGRLSRELGISDTI